MYTVTRYKRTRFFAVMHGADLVAVCVYRKGAEEVARRLTAREAELGAIPAGQRLAALPLAVLTA